MKHRTVLTTQVIDRNRQSLQRLCSLVIVFLVLVMSGVGCGNNNGDALLSRLLNSRMKLILKGTYASDRPLNFSEINGNQLFHDADDTLETAAAPTYDNLPIYLDIGEVRLSTKAFLQGLEQIQDSEDSADFWDVFSRERQVYCSRPYATDFDNDSCFNTGGLINYIEFMNGRGALFPTRDVGPGTYLHAGVYIRGFVTGYARASGALVETRFDNNRILDSQNVAPLMNYEAGTDAVQQQILAPQFFPLHHKVVWGQQPYMHVDNSFFPLIVEIRFNIKENLMLHSFSDANSLKRTVVGISDWRVGHADQVDMGGNVLTRTRMFYPDFVRDVRISGGTASTRHYYAVYVLNECADLNGDPGCKLEDQLPMAATPVRSGSDNILANMSAGFYRLECRYDEVHDGYPEKLLGHVALEVPVGPGEPVAIACACGASTTVGCN